MNFNIYLIIPQEESTDLGNQFHDNNHGHSHESDKEQDNNQKVSG